MAGERLSQARVGVDGVDGDRLVRVCGPEGVRTARRHHRLIGLHATIGADGRAWIDGHPWTSDAALALVREAAGDDAWLEAAPADERFDVLPLLVATDGAIAAFGRDVRRLRPNIVISGVEGLAEFDWPSRELHIGSVRILIDSRRPRCPMTTVDPDTTAVDPAVLKDIGRKFGGRLALNAEVLRGGTIKIEDAVRLEGQPAS
jgi:uncharacterized protein YcbX